METSDPYKLLDDPEIDAKIDRALARASCISGTDNTDNTYKGRKLYQVLGIVLPHYKARMHKLFNMGITNDGAMQERLQDAVISGLITTAEYDLAKEKLAEKLMGFTVLADYMQANKRKHTYGSYCLFYSRWKRELMDTNN